jgi:hypothetical protein
MKTSIYVLFLVLFHFKTLSQNVGIGTVTPQEKLDIIGAIRIGSTTSLNAGTIRYTNQRAELFNGSSWLSLVNDITIGSTGSLNSNVRGTRVDITGTSVIVPATGKYLLHVYLQGIPYQTNLEIEQYVLYVRNVTFSFDLMLKPLPRFNYMDDGVSTFQHFYIPFDLWSVQTLIQNEELKLQIINNSSNPGSTTSYNIAQASIELVRLN